MAPGTLSRTSPVAEEVCSVQVVSQCYLNEAYDNSPSANVSVSRDMDKIQRDGVIEPSIVLNGSPRGEAAEEDEIDLRFPVVRPYFLKNTPIDVAVTELFQSGGSSGRNVSYKIELKHDGYFWTIFRNYAQIQGLYTSLLHYNQSLPHNQTVAKNDPALRQIRKFPLIPEQLAPNSDLETRVEHCRSVEILLSDLLDHPLWREHETCRRFLVVSAVSFREGRVPTREKDQEIIVRKLSCPICAVHHNLCSHDNKMCQMFARWKFRWLIVQETCYLYIRPENGEIAAVFLFDQRMEIKYLHTRPNALMLKHNLKDLVLDFGDASERDTWISKVVEKMTSTGANWIKPQPHTSFAPVREDIYAKFFVNGASYMPAVADAIESAKEEIFIGGWWVAPEVFLKRPVTEGTRWRLDKILKRKAEEGVKIYILMYKESRVALGINSLYSKKKLAKIHPNIMVQRHPDHNVLLWSHHEKCVIIDQKLAFLGGIDLCYGRWDDHHYRMNDQSPEMRQSNPTGSMKKANESLAGRKFKKPKHKVGGPHRRGKKRYAWGQAAMAPVRGVQARMNVPQFRFGSKMNHRYRKYRRSFWGKTAAALGKCGRKKRSDLKEEDEREEELQDLGKTFTWIGKDYINEVKEAFSQPNKGHPYEDELDRDKVPRLPWHDAGTCIWGVAARDAARHYIQKWNACKFQKVRFEPEYPFILPKRYGDLESVDAPPCENAYRCRIQVLRSTASWSAGLLPHGVEKSIQQGYIDLITEAKHFVYMESQFFITTVAMHKRVKNEVGDAIFKRIVRAAKNGENFRLYIVIPLQPAIAGVYGTRGGAALQAVTHFIYRSISRGGFSIFEQLRLKGIDPSRYITISGLRQHDEISGLVATEIIYVHSKLMVVDDVYTIIGSANMNDRSMVGNRDSEIAILVEDLEFEDSVIDGRPYKSGKYSGRLRKDLMKVNLGLMDDMPRGLPVDEANLVVRDPVCEEFFRGAWIRNAVRNDEIYAQVFAPVPNDKVLRFSELKDWEKQKTLNETDPTKARELLRDVQGYVVKFPLKFLRDSKLLPTVSTAAGLLPFINWT